MMLLLMIEIGMHDLNAIGYYVQYLEEAPA